MSKKTVAKIVSSLRHARGVFRAKKSDLFVKGALKALRGARGWITILPVVSIARRRIGNLLPLKVEPGRKFLIGSMTEVRGRDFAVRGFGYELGVPVVHLEKLR